MPAFGFDEEEEESIVAFLEEVSQTGTGVPHLATLKEDLDPGLTVRSYLRATGETTEEPVELGEELLSSRTCFACHRPFSAGWAGAPDLTLAFSRRSPEYIRDIILHGKGMMGPSADLSDHELDNILSYLEWTNTNRSDLGRFHSRAENGGEFRWNAVPWWEYQERIDEQ